MRLASLCVLVAQAAALSAPRPRVAVVGPAGDTVADAVAVRLNDADVTRCINENAGYVDAAVVCADGGEEKLSALAERCAGARAIVLVAPAGAADEDDGFSLPNPLKLLDGAAETNDVEEVAERCRNGGARVAVVRHGPLFGAGARDELKRGHVVDAGVQTHLTEQGHAGSDGGVVVRLEVGADVAGRHERAARVHAQLGHRRVHRGGQ